MTVKHSQSKAKQNETTSSSPKKKKKERKQMGTTTKKYTKTVGKPGFTSVLLLMNHVPAPGCKPSTILGSLPAQLN